MGVPFESAPYPREGNHLIGREDESGACASVDPQKVGRLSRPIKHDGVGPSKPEISRGDEGHPMQHPKLVLTAMALLCFNGHAAAQDIRNERVRFAPGKTSTVIQGRITGYETVDYVLGARQGQPINVTMVSNNGANFFNILAPGETDIAFFNGSVSQNQYEGVLPMTGDYRIRVYLMRSAARRHEGAKYRIEVIVAAADKDRLTDAVVAGTAYHATGTIPCAMVAEQPMGSCPFGVVRSGPGSGTVTVTKQDGRTRTILFEGWKATEADVSQADPGVFRATRQGDLTTVHIGDERYEIPDAVISGG